MNGRTSTRPTMSAPIAARPAGAGRRRTVRLTVGARISLAGNSSPALDRRGRGRGSVRRSRMARSGDIEPRSRSAARGSHAARSSRCRTRPCARARRRRPRTMAVPLAAQSRAAVSTIASRTRCRSVGDEAMTRSTSAVAVCCSSASVTWRCSLSSVALLQLLEQPGVLDGDHRLVRERLQQGDLLVGERADVAVVRIAERADRLAAGAGAGTDKRGSGGRAGLGRLRVGILRVDGRQDVGTWIVRRSMIRGRSTQPSADPRSGRLRGVGVMVVSTASRRSPPPVQKLAVESLR